MLDAPAALPLVVDLDTLFTTRDYVSESIATLLFHQPRDLARLFLAWPVSRMRFSEAALSVARLDASALAVRTDLVQLLKTEKDRGRPLHLVAKCDEASARRLAAGLVLFDSVTGLARDADFGGVEEAERLMRRFPDGFIYAGASPEDAAIFRGAARAVLIGDATSLAKWNGALPVAAVSHDEPASPSTWARLLRFHQWSKNLLVFLPLLLSQAFMDTGSVARCIAAFLALGALASGTYIINDIADLAADRAHPVKRTRPIASGAISIVPASFAAAMLITIGIGSSVWLSHPFAAVACGYLVLTLAYSLGLKRVALLDTYIVGVLLTLRVAGGMALLAAPLSPWLISFSIALFTSLATAKRHGELHRIAASHSQRRTGRGYRAEDLPATFAFGVGSGLAALLIMLMYVNVEAAVTGLYRSPGWLYFIPAALMAWLQRVWLLAHRGVLDDDPVVFALQDPVSWFYGAACAAFWVLAMSV